jgi:UDP-3-O-[3-hydroxymyristoyl] glucosamine N-acyltransferase
MRLDELAKHIGADLDGDGSLEIDGVATLDDAGPRHLTFLSNPRYAAKVEATRAGAIIVGFAFERPLSMPRLRCSDPYLAMAQALALFHQPLQAAPGIHPTAIVESSARLGEDARVGPYCVIGAGTRIGARARLDAHVVIGPECEIGDDFTAHAHVSVRERVRIGARVVLQNGAVVGGDGFGYVPTPDGIRKLPQTGTVILEDDVEVGANSTIDRSTLGATRIGRGSKIDNLVQVAHGCEIGEGCFVAAQTGLAGSSRVGNYVQLGGQVGLAGHLEIGDFARVGAKSGVSNDLAGGKTYASGVPAFEIGLYRRVIATLRSLPELVKRVRALEAAGKAKGERDPG